MPKSPRRKTLHVIAKYFYESANDVEGHIVKTYNSFDPNEWNVTIHSSTDTLMEKNTMRKREMIGEIQVRRSESGFFGFTPKIQWDKSDLICLYSFKLFPHIFVLLKTLTLKILGQKKYALMLIPQGGYDPYWKRYSYLRRIGKKLFHAFLGRILINLSVDGILTTSIWERREMVKEGIRRELIVTIPNGVEPEAFDNIELKASSQIRTKIAEYGSYIIQIGRIHPVKNYETTIKALVHLPSNVNLVIAGPVGDKNYMSRLKNLIHELDVEKRVFFHGIIRSYDKYYLIRHAQLLVHAPLWDASGTVIYEGMSQGLICVSSDVAAPQTIVKEDVNGFLVTPTDDLELGKKIHVILNNKESEQFKQMSVRNRRIGREHKSDVLQRKLEILYSSVLMKHKYPYRLNMSRAI